MLKCRDIAHLSSDYLDRNMTLPQRLDMALHLLLCGNCRAFIRHMRLALVYYRRLPKEPLEDSVAAGIAKRARERN